MSDERRSGIYAIVHLASGRAYVGSSKDLQYRLFVHRRRLEGKRHENRYLQRAWNKHGAAAFSFVVLAETPIEDLFVAEQRCLDSAPHLFNICRKAGAPPSQKGVPKSELHREKIGRAHRGKTYSAETLAKMSLAQARRAAEGRMPKMSAEARRRQSEYRKAHPELTAAMHAAVGESNRRRVWTPEMKKKKSAALSATVARRKGQVSLW